MKLDIRSAKAIISLTTGPAREDFIIFMQALAQFNEDLVERLIYDQEHVLARQGEARAVTEILRAIQSARDVVNSKQQ
jgi:hypothetical protein